MLIVFCLFLIILLFVRQNRLIELEREQKKIVKEMEDVISSYLLEMKEENEAFIERVQTTHRVKTLERLKEEEPGSFTDIENPLIKKATPRSKAIAAYKPSPLKMELKEKKRPNVEEIEESIPKEEDPFVRQVLFLDKKGLDSAKIAKVLNKGQTEIQLLLKFRKNDK